MTGFMVMTVILLCWFVLGFLSLIYVTFDLARLSVTSLAIKTAWWLVTLYAGPVALYFYLRVNKELKPDSLSQKLWPEAIDSTAHRLAGSVTGILIAALILSPFKLGMGLDFFIEYVAGFVCGLFVFQAVCIKKKMLESYSASLARCFYPEFVSMNMIMAGMIPVMVLWEVLAPLSKHPSSLLFWGKISCATIIGGATAYSINKWLIVHGLKHGLTKVKE